MKSCILIISFMAVCLFISIMRTMAQPPFTFEKMTPVITNLRGSEIPLPDLDNPEKPVQSVFCKRISNAIHDTWFKWE